MEEALIDFLATIIELEKTYGVKSLFNVVARCGMDYSWGWRVLTVAESRGYVTVERSGAGVPLNIASTETGQEIASQPPPAQSDPRFRGWECRFGRAVSRA